MVKCSEIKSNAKQFLALTSLMVEEFEHLLVSFEENWLYQMTYFTFDGKPRERAYKEKGNGILPLVEDKLFFILCYLKTHPLQESLAASFAMTQPQANKCIHLYKEVLHQALAKSGTLPARQAVELKKMLRESDEKEFYTDGVERLIPRSTDKEVQKDNYSGKKKTHTNKNTIFSGQDCHIYFLSDTCEGKTHDKKINELEEVSLPHSSTCFQDTGFIGYRPKGENIKVIMPTKKPKGKELSPEQKKQNTLISRLRVKVEHVMAGIKRLRIIKDEIRAWANNFRDQVMEIACGLHNFRLIFRPWNYPKAEKNLQT